MGCTESRPSAPHNTRHTNRAAVRPQLKREGAFDDAKVEPPLEPKLNGRHEHAPPAQERPAPAPAAPAEAAAAAEDDDAGAREEPAKGPSSTYSSGVEGDDTQLLPTTTPPTVGQAEAKSKHAYTRGSVVPPPALPVDAGASINPILRAGLSTANIFDNANDADSRLSFDGTLTVAEGGMLLQQSRRANPMMARKIMEYQHSAHSPSTTPYRDERHANVTPSCLSEDGNMELATFSSAQHRYGAASYSPNNEGRRWSDDEEEVFDQYGTLRHVPTQLRKDMLHGQKRDQPPINPNVNYRSTLTHMDRVQSQGTDSSHGGTPPDEALRAPEPPPASAERGSRSSHRSRGSYCSRVDGSGSGRVGESKKGAAKASVLFGIALSGGELMGNGIPASTLLQAIKAAAESAGSGAHHMEKSTNMLHQTGWRMEQAPLFINLLLDTTRSLERTEGIPPVGDRIISDAAVHHFAECKAIFDAVDVGGTGEFSAWDLATGLRDSKFVQRKLCIPPYLGTPLFRQIVRGKPYATLYSFFKYYHDKPIKFSSTPVTSYPDVLERLMPHPPADRNASVEVSTVTDALKADRYLQLELGWSDPEAAFAVLGTNVTHESIEKLLKLRWAWTRADTAHDGFIGACELGDALEEPDVSACLNRRVGDVRTIWKELDTSGTGVTMWYDFYKFFSRTPASRPTNGAKGLSPVAKRPLAHIGLPAVPTSAPTTGAQGSPVLNKKRRHILSIHAITSAVSLLAATAAAELLARQQRDAQRRPSMLECLGDEEEDTPEPSQMVPVPVPAPAATPPPRLSFNGLALAQRTASPVAPPEAPAAVAKPQKSPRPVSRPPRHGLAASAGAPPMRAGVKRRDSEKHTDPGDRVFKRRDSVVRAREAREAKERERREQAKKQEAAAVAASAPVVHQSVPVSVVIPAAGAAKAPQGGYVCFDNNSPQMPAAEEKHRSYAEAPTPKFPELMHPGDRYDKVKKLGEGNFGVVFLVERKTDGLLLVTKEPKRPTGGMTAQKKAADARRMRKVQKEAAHLMRLRHPNILRFIEAYWESGALVIVTEYCDGGDLSAWLTRFRSTASISVKWSIFEQIAAALAYMHERGVLHRDLKPANILLTSRSIVKLADFGLARALRPEEEVAHTICGTELYMAPEVHNRTPYGRAADVFALGCILYQMVKGRKPYVNLMELMECRPPTDAPKYSQKLIKDMLNPDPTTRPSMAQVLRKCPEYRPRRKQALLFLLWWMRVSRQKGDDWLSKSLAIRTLSFHMIITY